MSEARGGVVTSSRIGVLMGGNSSEREISLRTGAAVHAALRRRGYDAVTIDAAGALIEQLRQQKVEIAFLALHGPGGEDGTIQGLLELLGIPYTGSGVRASAIAMHKPTAKLLLEAAGVPVPAGILVAVEEAPRFRRPPAGLRGPLIVKPASQGSTIGISIVRRPADWRPALARALEHDTEALAEAYVAGRELTVAVLSGRALPAVEIVAPEGFYDYSAKYEKGRTRYLCPAPLTPALRRRLAELAVRAYRVLGCAGAARVDFRLTPRGRPYVLEVNTIPGMTETSLLPMAAAQAGLSYDELTEQILASALRAGRQAGGRKRAARRTRRV